jgi:polysaccharide export outer membrane protein
MGFNFKFLCIVGGLAIGGGSSLPDSGPSAADVASQQTDSAQYQRYMVVDITPATIDALSGRGPASLSAKFGDSRVSREPVIGIGDTVSVTIWEASSGGLFSAPLISE